MIKLAFYKGKGNLFNVLVRLWTRCKYSHCELVFSDGYFFSADPRWPGARYKKIVEDTTKWDFVDIHADTFDENRVRRWCNTQSGKKYDWAGILLSQIFPMQLENPNKYFCSELCVSAIKQLGRLSTVVPSETSPKDLAKIYGLII